MVFYIIVGLIIVLMLSVWFDFMIPGMLAIGAAMALFIAIFVSLPSVDDQQYWQNQQVTVQNLKETSVTSTKASIYLSDGNTKNTTINYVVVDDNGAIEFKTAPADRAKIYEKDGVSPTVKITKYDVVSSFWVPWTLKTIKQYEFTVPKNSIK